MKRSSWFTFRHKKIIGLFAAVFAISSIASMLLPAATQAATLSTDSTLKNQAYAYALYNSMVDCLGQKTQQKDTSGFAPFISYRTSAANLKSGTWWNESGSVYVGATQGAESPASYISKNVREKGATLCNDIVKDASSVFGYDSVFEFACSFIDTRANGSSCKTGTGDFKEFTLNVAKFKDVISKKVWGGTPTLTISASDKNAGLYIIYREAFLNGCSPKESSSASGNFAYKDVRIVKDDSTSSTKTYEGLDRGTTLSTYRTGNGVEQKNCGELASLVNKYATDYSAYLQSHKTDNGALPATGGTSANCADQAYANAHKEDCKTDTGQSTCQIDGIGWILCPVANAMAGLTDASFAAVKSFMNVAPLSLNPQDNDLYTAWSTMRSIANVAFVIVFLVIIFSQLTSLGVSNYGVKKLLPRLVIGAILVNISFFICAIAVDVSNILGSSIQQAFHSIEVEATNAPDYSPGQEWTSITASVLTFGAATVGGVTLTAAFAAGGIWGALAGLLPLLVAALFALVVAFLVLLARQALIIMLIVIAPLAFIAYLLPNTESLFKKWQSLFVTLLALFPMLAIVFGGSQLAATILRNTSQSNAIQSSTPITAFFLYIGSFAVQAIPFFITPVLIKLSSGVLGRFAGVVNNRNKGPFDGLRRGGERIAKDAQNRGFTRKLTRGNNFSDFGARRRARIERRTSGLENSAKLAANNATTKELAQLTKNGDPSKLAMQMTAGNEEQARLMSLQANSKLVEEETGVAREAITEANLSGAQKLDLARTGKLEVKNIEGKITAKFEGEASQRAAIQEVFASGSYANQAELAEKSSISKEQGGLQDFAQTIAQGVIKNGVGAKDPTFSGKRLDALSQGKFNYDEGAKVAMTEGKFTATAFARMNDDGREKVIKIAQDAAASGDTQYIDALRSAAQGIQNSVELKSEIAGNTKALAHIESLAPASNNSRPPSAGSGSGPGGMVMPNDPGFNNRQ